MICNRHRGLTVFATGLVATAILLGCSGARSDRVDVFGTVTLDDKPLESGAILFLPKDAGPSAGTQIEGGRFAIARRDGPAPGEYRVEIRSYRNTGQMVPDDDYPGEMIELREQIIPVRYNEASELEVVLSADTRRRELAFTLHSE